MNPSLKTILLKRKKKILKEFSKILFLKSITKSIFENLVK